MSATRLDQYSKGNYTTGAGPLKGILWYVINAWVFRSSWFPFNQFKTNLLRLFGARVGMGVVIKPRVNIKFPWRLRIGDYCWIGEGVWIDNLAAVELGSHVCLSQDALILTGNHDYKKASFDLITEAIRLEDGVWIGAKALVIPGTKARSHSVLTAGSVSPKEMLSNHIYTGNPAIPVRERLISEVQTH
ncbi:MAG TPA: WcaF family extracellular polysaccharide biosynthesis acetyltransferase [Luteibaculaceae bacterium]|nr:WcaF family extracellular polysaccharide biosynthesis acetyltransferase [Luteibaculaceae bacterium]